MQNTFLEYHDETFDAIQDKVEDAEEVVQNILYYRNYFYFIYFDLFRKLRSFDFVSVSSILKEINESNKDLMNNIEDLKSIIMDNASHSMDD